MSVVNLKVLIYINMCCILPTEWQIENEGWFFASISEYKLYGILWMNQNILTKTNLLVWCSWWFIWLVNTDAMPTLDDADIEDIYFFPLL